MSIIEYVEAREILDSRGNPTVEVDVVLELLPVNTKRSSFGMMTRVVTWEKAFSRLWRM